MGQPCKLYRVGNRACTARLSSGGPSCAGASTALRSPRWRDSATVRSTSCWSRLLCVSAQREVFGEALPANLRDAHRRRHDPIHCRRGSGRVGIACSGVAEAKALGGTVWNMDLHTAWGRRPLRAVAGHRCANNVRRARQYCCCFLSPSKPDPFSSNTPSTQDDKPPNERIQA